MDWILSFWYSKPTTVIDVLTPLEKQLIEARSKLKKATINDKDRIFQMNLRQAKANLKYRDTTPMEKTQQEHEFLKIKLRPIKDKLPTLVKEKVNPIHQELLQKSILIQ